MQYTIKKYSSLKPAVELFIAELINPTNIDIEGKCELLLTAHELKLKGKCIDNTLNDITILSVNEINLTTSLIRQIVINKYDILEDERQEFIKYWLYDGFYKEQNIVTVSIIFWNIIDNYGYLSQEWKLKLARKTIELEKNIQSITARAWFPFYLEKLNHVDLSNKVAKEILANREKNGSWSGNVEKTLKIAYALSCSNSVKEQALHNTIDFINKRMLSGIDFNVNSCALVIKLYYRLGIIGDDLVEYIQKQIQGELKVIHRINNNPPKRKVIISYSHSDIKWLNKLIIHLKPLEREGLLELWSDNNITPGENWVKEIKEALNSASVAVLLISPDYLASDFINNQELPLILNSARLNRTTILPLIIRHSMYSYDKNLGQIQSVNSPDKPLEYLKKSEQDKIFTDLAIAINKCIDVKTNPQH